MGSNVPRISVIIPALNEEKYIKRCIDSIRRQTFKDFEIITIANGCTDKTASIAESLSRVYEITDKGVSHARNTGAKKAKGRIVVFIDADSIMSSNLLNKINTAYGKGYLGGTCNTWSDTKNIIDLSFWGITNLVSWIFRVPNGFFFVDRKLFFKAGSFDEKLTIGEDTELLYAVKKIRRIRFIKTAYIKTSMRRFRKLGYFHTIFTWVSAFFNPKKSEYVPVR